MNPNGWVVIGSKLDRKQLEKDIKDAERQLQQFEKEGEQLAKQKADLEVDLQDVQTAKELIEEQFEESRKLATSEEELNGIIEQQSGLLELFDLGLQKINDEMSEVNQKTRQNEKNQEGIKKSIDESKQKLAQFNAEAERGKKIEGIKKGVDDINRGLKNSVKSVVRWALAFIGIGSAISFLSSSISTISQYNSQVATDIEYIRFALASTLEPVVIRLINLVKTLLYYVGYIAKAWFGVDLFANASVDKFKKNEKAIGGAAKNAKELNKQLAGFDEMNVLQDNTDTGGGGGGGAGGDMPSFNLQDFDGKVPDWLQWIADHKDEILAFMAGVAAGLLAWKLGLSALTSLGIGLIIAGIVLAIEGLLGYLKDPSWKNFGKIIQGIGVAIIGLGVAVLGLPAIIVGVIVLIYGTIIKYWDQIKAWLDGVVQTFKDRSDSVHKVFGDTIGNIYDALVNFFANMVQGWDNSFKAIKRIFDDLIAIVKAIINGDWKTAWTRAKDIVATIFNTIVANIKLAFNAIKGLAVSIGSAVGNAIAGAVKGVVNAVLNQAENVLNKPINAINGVLSVLNKLPGVSIGRLQTIRLPRLAKGGIINQPGRGVMLGSAIAGEHGAEGVIPLTDSQQMALLGEAIGRYITINASITNTMNGRVISRELKKVQNENDFAYNR